MRRRLAVATASVPRWSRFGVLGALLATLLFAACSGGGGGGGGASADASIAGLVLTAGSLSPPFQPEVLAYAADVPAAVSAVQVVVTAADPAARITVAGAPVASGVPSAAIPLQAGANELRIAITAADAVTTRTYVVAVTRGSGPALSALVLSAGTLSPAFASDTTAYAAAVDNGIGAVTVTATTTVAGASLTTNGLPVVSGQPSAPILLAAGQNAITVQVATASATRDYVVVVTRQAATDVPELSALQLSVGALGPAFAPGTTSYTATVGFLVEMVTVTATTTLAGASITTNGVPVVSGQPSAPIALAEGPNTITVRVTTAASATRDYAIVLTRQSAGQLAQEAYIKASNPDPNDGFGVRVALSGETLAVGTWFEDSSATGVGGNEADNGAFGSGAVYVFVRSGTTWTQQAYLKASNTGIDDAFGFSIALSGDTLAVGAINEDSSASGIGGDENDNSRTDSGAVYVFVRSGATWTQQAYLKASNPGAGDGFGHGVALDGDTLAVAARDEDSSATGIDGQQLDNGASGSGAVYVFTRAGSTWTQQAYVKASNTGVLDHFGQSLAVSGDTLAVAARDEDGGATGIDGNAADNSKPESGAVYVFTRSGATWTQQAYVKASNTDAGDQFGASVALRGDTLAVGAVGEASGALGSGGTQQDNSKVSSGAVYVFTRSGATWTQQAYVKASNTDANDQFGCSVALGDDRLAVGAFGESSGAVGIDGFQPDNTALSSGAAYLFARSGAIWTQQAYVKASNTDAVDLFGLGVAWSGDTLVVGAFGEDGGAAGVGGNEADNSRADSGAVYVFR